MPEDPCRPSIKKSLNQRERHELRYLTTTDARPDIIADSIVGIDALREETKCERDTKVVDEWRQGLDFVVSSRKGRLDEFLSSLEKKYDEAGVPKRLLSEIRKMPLGVPRAVRVAEGTPIERVGWVGPVRGPILRAFGVASAEMLASMTDEEVTELKKKLEGPWPFKRIRKSAKEIVKAKKATKASKPA